MRLTWVNTAIASQTCQWENRPWETKNSLVHPMSAPKRQAARVQELRGARDQAAVDKSLQDVKDAARGTQNLLYPMKDALRSKATLGEVSDALREVFGVYQPAR